MSLDRSPEAERVLMRIRASADPAPGVARRVLAGVEQRIALPGDAARIDTDAAPRAPMARASHWRGASHVAARLGRWGAFGLIAGAIGYHLGFTARDRAEDAVAAASVAALASEATDATPVVASRAMNTDATPAPVSPGAVPSAAAASAVVLVEPALPLGVALDPPARSPAARAVRVASRSRAVPLRASRASGATLGKPAEPPLELDLAAVLERVLRAQGKLRDGDPHAALEQLDALDVSERGRPGLLVDERLVVRALALCDIGRIGDARRVLSELDGRGAESIYSGRLTQSCSAALER